MNLRFTLLANNKAPSYSQGTYTSYGYVVNTGKDRLLAYTRHKREYVGIDTDLLAFLTWTLKSKKRGNFRE